MTRSKIPWRAYIDGVGAIKLFEELGVLLLLKVLDVVGATEPGEGVELLEYPGTEELEGVGVTKLDEELIEALEEETDEDVTTIALNEDVTATELDDVVDTEELKTLEDSSPYVEELGTYELELLVDEVADSKPVDGIVGVTELLLEEIDFTELAIVVNADVEEVELLDSDICKFEVEDGVEITELLVELVTSELVENVWIVEPPPDNGELVAIEHVEPAADDVEPAEDKIGTVKDDVGEVELDVVEELETKELDDEGTSGDETRLI